MRGPPRPRLWSLDCVYRQNTPPNAAGLGFSTPAEDLCQPRSSRTSSVCPESQLFRSKHMPVRVGPPHETGGYVHPSSLSLRFPPSKGGDPQLECGKTSNLQPIWLNNGLDIGGNGYPTTMPKRFRGKGARRRNQAHNYPIVAIVLTV